MRTLPVEIAGSDPDLTMLLGGIAPLLVLGFRLSPIRVPRPLRSCPLLVLDRSFLPVRPCVVTGRHLFPVTRIVAGGHLLPVTWLIVSCIGASRFEVSRLRGSGVLVSYCIIVPGKVPGIVVP